MSTEDIRRTAMLARHGGDKEMSEGYTRVMTFRRNAQDMGLRQVNVYVPENRKAWVQAHAEIYRAEDALNNIAQLPVDDPARIALANRNFTTMPTRNHMDWAETMIRARKMDGQLAVLREVREYMTQHNIHKNALAAVHDDAEIYRIAGLAVAYSMMAAALYKMLKLEIEEEMAKPLPSEGK
jgi:hypothetical protein